MKEATSGTSRTIGEKTFTDQDQREFAKASRDWNPMHMDAIAARRLLSGRQVVHGIHTLVHALELSSLRAPAPPRTVVCNFAHPINVGDRVLFTEIDKDHGQFCLLASVDGLACTEVDISLAKPCVGRPRLESSDQPVRHLGELTAPLDESPQLQVGSLFEVASWTDDLATRFPHATEVLGVVGLNALARLSFFVGMVCPGLHSVFSSARFTLADSRESLLRFVVRNYDPRFRLFTVAFEGAIEGEIRAFLRPRPQSQPRASEVASQLAGSEFRGTRSLVIGGSRGLGETTAKIIAGGGGDVIISYAVGSADAQGVCREINQAGRGHCDAVHLDLRQVFTGASNVDPALLDAVYFFSTPRIYAKRNEVFDRGAFNEFVDFYLLRFYELCRWLEAVERNKPIQVYLPSSVAITERPRGMTEYAMAKVAAEVLAADLNRNLRNVRVIHTRLPRLATDQTASILNVSVASNLDVMMDVVRQMSSAINSL